MVCQTQEETNSLSILKGHPFSLVLPKCVQNHFATELVQRFQFWLKPQPNSHAAGAGTKLRQGCLVRVVLQEDAMPDVMIPGFWNKWTKHISVIQNDRT